MFGGLGPENPLGAPVQDFYRQGGSVAIIVRATNDPDPLDPPAYARALDALRRTDLVNLLVVPGDLTPETVAAAISFAEERRAFFVMDPPSTWTTVEGAVAGAGSPAFARSSNAAIYFPRIRQPGPARATSGAVAGTMARNDVTRGVWTAPAGVEAELEGVTELDLTVNDVDAGRLNVLGVNCLRTFPSAAPVVWGARTTDTTDSEWRYVNVRRTALFLEKSIDLGIRWATFEPNDEPLWAQIRLNVGAFMNDLFRQGAFQGRMARDAYLVKCDRETTTQNDVNLGIVNILVGFAPLKPAEFVILKIQQLAGQVQV